MATVNKRKNGIRHPDEGNDSSFLPCRLTLVHCCAMEKTASPPVRSFASDNNAGVHPEVLEAIGRANRGHVVAYGDDPYTRSAVKKFEEQFGGDIAVFFTFNGTGANVLGLQALTRSFQSVLCSDYAHINTDECGAPEKHTGCKLIPLPHQDGKITLDSVRHAYHGIGDPHHSQPRVISITQSTEMGTVYRPDEIQALARFAHERGMFLHVDGARIANAAASLGQTLRQATRDLGVDVLSFGGTKNGTLGGEAVVFFNPHLRKTSFSCASKACNWRRKCASSPRNSKRCSLTTYGGAALSRPITWRACWKKKSAASRKSRLCGRLKPMAFSPRSRPTPSKNQETLLLLYVDGGGVDRALDVLLRYHRGRRPQVCQSRCRGRERVTDVIRIPRSTVAFCPTFD